MNPYRVADKPPPPEPVVLTPGDRVLFKARDLRDGERPVEMDGVVDRVRGEHVWLRIGGGGRMCIARRAILCVCERGAA